MQKEILQLRTLEGGLLAIRKDAVTMVRAQSECGRNLTCSVNEIPTKEGYDFVLAVLGWNKVIKP